MILRRFISGRAAISVCRNRQRIRGENSTADQTQYYRLGKPGKGAVRLDSNGQGVSIPTETGTGSRDGSAVRFSTILDGAVDNLKKRGAIVDGLQ